MGTPNVVVQVERAFVSNLPVAPSSGQTVVLFATHPCTLGTGGASVTSTFERGGGSPDPSGTTTVIVDPDALEEIEATFAKHDVASAANGLRAYQLLDDGTWAETDMKGYVGGVANQPTIGSAAAIQVPALTTGQEWSENFDVGRYRGFALTYTAGTSNLSEWKLTIAAKYAKQGG